MRGSPALMLVAAMVVPLPASCLAGGGSNNAPATAPATTPAPTPAPTPTPTPTPTTTPAPTPQGQQCISTAYGQMAYTQQQLQCLSSSAEASDTVQAFFAASALVGVAILGDDSSLGNLLGDQAVYAALKGRGSFKDIVKGYVDWSQQASVPQVRRILVHIQPRSINHARYHFVQILISMMHDNNNNASGPPPNPVTP